MNLSNQKTSNELIIFWSPFPSEPYYPCSEIFTLSLSTKRPIQCIDYLGIPDAQGLRLLHNANLVIITLPQNPRQIDHYFFCLYHQFPLSKAIYLITDYFPTDPFDAGQIRLRYRLSALQLLTLSYNRRFYDANLQNSLPRYLDQILHTHPNAAGICLKQELSQFHRAVFHALDIGISIVPAVKTVSSPS